MTRLPVSAFPELEGLPVMFPLKHGTDPGFLSLSGAETRDRTLRTPAEFTERQRLRFLARPQMCHVLSVPPWLTWEDTGVSLPAVLDVPEAPLDGTEFFIWAADFHTKGRLLYLC